MARFSTAARRISVSAVLITAATFGTITAAQAAPDAGAALAGPTGCDVSVWTFFVDAYCSSGSGEYRATTRCDVNNWPDYNRYGKWVTKGHDSYAYCDSKDRAFNAGLQTR